jgi:hypothetical protein
MASHSAPLPRAHVALAAATGLLCALFALSVFVPALRDGAGASFVWDTLAYNGTVLGATGLCVLRALRVASQRWAWAALGLAMALSTGGDLYWTLMFSGLEDVPYPSPADALYIGFYPFACLGLLLLVRAGIGRLRVSAWLDGVVCGMAMAAVSAAVAFDRIAAGTRGDALTVGVTLSYPVGDLLLILLVFCVLGLTALRPGRAWVLLGLGLVLWAVGDTVYLLQQAAGTYVEGEPVDLSWALGAFLIGAAAWQPST